LKIKVLTYIIGETNKLSIQIIQTLLNKHSNLKIYQSDNLHN